MSLEDKNDMFRALLEMHVIVAADVPPNMANYFQTLDLTIYGVPKTFLKDKYLFCGYKTPTFVEMWPSG